MPSIEFSWHELGLLLGLLEGIEAKGPLVSTLIKKLDAIAITEPEEED